MVAFVEVSFYFQGKEYLTYVPYDNYIIRRAIISIVCLCDK